MNLPNIFVHRLPENPGSKDNIVHYFTTRSGKKCHYFDKNGNKHCNAIAHELHETEIIFMNELFMNECATCSCYVQNTKGLKPLLWDCRMICSENQICLNTFRDINWKICKSHRKYIIQKISNVIHCKDLVNLVFQYSGYKRNLIKLKPYYSNYLESLK